MVVFSVFIIIVIFIGKKWTKDSTAICLIMGILLGLGASFLGGSFVKKEIVEEKYFVSPMIVDGKPVVALLENISTYIFQVNDNETGTRLIKLFLSKEEIFLTDNSEKRYLKIKISKIYRKKMWIWFFCRNKIVGREVIIKNADNFLTLPNNYSFSLNSFYSFLK